MTFFQLLDYPFTVIMIKGTTSTATTYSDGSLEYVCEAEVGCPTNALTWRIRKLEYDATGFNTSVKWAEGTRNFDKRVDYATTSYTYA
jgi:hypothetical protein